MKTLAITLCLAGAAFGLTACETSSSTYASGASYAEGRTAGEAAIVKQYKPTKTKVERVFKTYQSK